MSAYSNCIKYYANDDIYDDQINYDRLDFEDSLDDYAKDLEKDLNYDENTNENILQTDKGLTSLMRLITNPLNSYYIQEIDILFDNVKSLKTIRTTTEIIRFGDVINTIYLDITLPDTYDFNNLSLQEKFALFNINLELTIGGSSIWRNNLLSNLFNMICTNINIKSDSNKIQIPIFDFSMMKTLKIKENNIRLNNDEKGLSHCSLQYHELRINMENKYRNYKIYEI